MDPYQPPEESRPAPQPVSSYNIKHHDIGGVLDQAVALAKDHFFSLFKILAVSLIPINIASGMAMLSIMPPQPPMGAPPEQSEQFFREMIQAFQDNLPMLLVIWAILLVVYPVSQAAVIHAAAKLYLGKSVTVKEALQAGLSRIFSFLGVSILAGLSVFAGMIMCLLPGIFLGIIFCLATHVVVIEKAGPIDGLSRSVKLVWPDILTAGVVGVLLFFIGGSVGFGAALIPQPHIQQILQVLLQSVMTIFSTTTFVVFYFSCRCGLENFDLQHMAESIDGDGSNSTGSDRLDDGTNFFGQPE